MLRTSRDQLGMSMLSRRLLAGTRGLSTLGLKWMRIEAYAVLFLNCNQPVSCVRTSISMSNSYKNVTPTRVVSYSLSNGCGGFSLAVFLLLWMRYLQSRRMELRGRQYHRRIVSDELLKGGTAPEKIWGKKLNTICTCHNFFPLSSVQIIIIPACCLLCVL